ncbi:SPFH domain-containing protein [Companilactobacillus huachuanensis]|uniref:SPFH domain-containing protein n=1 Tax=Companilactobacillus huachuanensis TaxID=2559914 RepID=A0ABW1RMR6_9LACO|nr:SPFH domain-containing protein [Companilactobacillus huachuanensis]
MFGLKIVRQNHVGLVETLGKYRREVSAGLNIYIPLFQKIRIVDLAMIPLSLKGYSVITKDNAEVETNITLNYHITDARKFQYENSNSVESMIQLVRGHLRDIIGKLDLNEALGSTSKINADLANAIGDLTDTYGTKVDRVNIDELKPSASITESMEKQIRADREKTAAIAKANGDARSIEIETKARNEATVSTAKAEAEATIARADAKAYEIKKLNDTLAAVDNKYFTAQQIQAFAALANSPANTVVMDKDSIGKYADIPVTAKVMNQMINK